MNPKVKHILYLIALGLALAVLLGYCLFAVIYFKAPTTTPCKSVYVCVKDSATHQYINREMIHQYLQKKNAKLYGYKIGVAETDQIEKWVKELSPVKEAQCYMGYDSCLYIDIWQRNPLFRVIPHQGKSYYIDEDKKPMPLSNLFTPYVPILSGHVNSKAAQNEWFAFMQYLLNDKTWHVLIAEVHVNAKQQICLTSRQGVPYIEIGNLENAKENMEKLRIWYQQYPAKNNPDIYEKISIQYNNLIFCSKSNNHE
jgi:cell division protein FtsQ